MQRHDDEAMRDAVGVLLAAIGEDPEREGLIGTPGRVSRAWKEMMSGYTQDPARVLKANHGPEAFDDIEGYSGIVVVSGVEFTSMCEHHLMPFTGRADVGYLPGKNGSVVGLSKLARLVHVFARRLQIQERLTQEIAVSLRDALGARGVGVRVRSVHSCMSSRGVRAHAPMTTQVLLGAFREDAALRAEFLSLADHGHKGLR